MRYVAKLTQVQSDRSITKDTDPEFLFEFQKSILLALKEHSLMSDIQYRSAEEKLRAQFRSFFGSAATEGEDGR